MYVFVFLSVYNYVGRGHYRIKNDLNVVLLITWQLDIQYITIFIANVTSCILYEIMRQISKWQYVNCRDKNT